MLSLLTLVAQMSMPMPMPMPMPKATSTSAHAPQAPAIATAAPSARPTPMPEPAVVEPFAQAGSGTSRVPAAASMFGSMAHGARWTTMTHYAAFPRFVKTGSARGARRFDAPNWAMIDASRTLGDASLDVRAMLSLDSLTENRSGYPLLLQSGERAYGAPLHDRQHPHDLVDELSVAYTWRAGNATSAFVYAGEPGEPALGPPTFMHRRIAYDMADAPLGHHWEDATHVTFGVVSAGVSTARVRVEASRFNGREPDEVRTNIEPVRLDSTAARLSWSPSAALAAQVSFGFVHAPDPAEPGVDVHRTTASLIYDRRLDGDREHYAALVWGRNLDALPGATATNAALVEFDVQHGRSTWFGRAERVTKTGADLALPIPLSGVRFDLGAATVGYVRDLAAQPGGAVIGLGTQVTVSAKPAALDPFYGAGVPLAFELFARIRPPRHGAGTRVVMHGHEGMKM